MREFQFFESIIEKNNFFNNNFFKVIEKTEQTLSAESFFKALVDLSRFFSKIKRYVFIWVFPDFLDILNKLKYQEEILRALMNLVLLAYREFHKVQLCKCGLSFENMYVYIQVFHKWFVSQECCGLILINGVTAHLMHESFMKVLYYNHLVPHRAIIF
jgi:hypothetical protein